MQTSPVSDVDRFTQKLQDYERRIADLERTISRGPGAIGRVVAGALFDSATSGTTKLVVSTTASTPMSAGRKYIARLELSHGWYGSVAGDGFTIGIEQDGTALDTCPVYINSSNNYIPPGSLVSPFTTTTASHVYRATAIRDAGTGSLQFRGRLYIYDDGSV